MIEDSNDDAAFESGLAALTDERWREFFGWDITRADLSDDAPGFGRWYELAYDLGVVQPYPWMEWVDANGKPFFDSRDLSGCSLADAIRIVTAIVRSDRTSESHLVAEMGSGLATAAVRRIWKWYQSAISNNAGFVDASCYSDDEVYRWSYERRWGVGGSLCWIGLNPGTGDTDGKKRPTLTKVCRWAELLGLESVVVVNLFAYRSTDPKALRTAGVDIVGDFNDQTIRSAVERSAVTLAARGGGGKINDRGRAIAATYDTLMCLGITGDGEPRHPLYVPQAIEPALYRRPPV